MKAIRWTAVGLIVIFIAAAIALFVANAKRNELGRGVLNRLFADTGLIVTDLTVAAITTRKIDVDRIVVMQAGGNEFRASDVSVELDYSELWPTRVSIGDLEFLPGADPSPPTALTPLLSGMPALLGDLRAIDIDIARVVTPGLPAIIDLSLSKAADALVLSLQVADMSITGRLGPGNDVRDLVAAVDVRSVGVTGQVRLALATSAGTLGVTGDAELPTDLLFAVMPAVDDLPFDVSALEATLTGRFSLGIDEPAAGDIAVDADLFVPGQLLLKATPDAGLPDVTIVSTDGVRLTYAYPEGAWTAVAERVVAGVPALYSLSATFENLACDPGIRCGFDARFTTGLIESEAFSVAALEGRSTVSAHLADTLRVVGKADSQVSANNLISQAAELGSVTINLASDFMVTAAADGWSAAVERFGWSADRLRADVPQLGRWTGSLQGSGRLDADADAVDIALVASAGRGRPGETAVAMRYDLAGNRLDIEVDNAGFDLGDKALSRWFSDWAQPWDLVAGNVRLGGSAGADLAGDEPSVTATASLRFENVAGRYDDIGLVGLAANVDARLDPSGNVDIEPFAVAVDLLEVGMPVENITATVDPDLGNETIRVADLELQALGGYVRAEPFDYSLTADTNTLTLSADSLQLAFMVGLLDLDDIETSGTVSGRIPVTIRNGKVIVDAGRLESDEQGGTIRVGQGSVDFGAIAGNSGMQTVLNSLQNFQFETLSSDVSYTDAGDLKLQIRMKGTNPQVDPTQPIILNLGVENNIPQLFRSLQAVRSIEDILQREAQN